MTTGFLVPYSSKLEPSNIPFAITLHFRVNIEDIFLIVSVIQSGFEKAVERRHAEARIIFRHKTPHPRGVYTDFAFIFSAACSRDVSVSLY